MTRKSLISYRYFLPFLSSFLIKRSAGNRTCTAPSTKKSKISQLSQFSSFIFSQRVEAILWRSLWKGISKQAVKKSLIPKKNALFCSPFAQRVILWHYLTWDHKRLERRIQTTVFDSFPMYYKGCREIYPRFKLNRNWSYFLFNCNFFQSYRT